VKRYTASTVLKEPTTSIRASNLQACFSREKANTPLLPDPERRTIAGIGKRLGRKHLADVASVAKPDTILAWYRRLIACKFDRSKHRSYPGRPRVDAALEELIIRMAQENTGRHMIGYPAHWPISDTVSPLRPSETS
jgi:hypothetical protein